MRNPLRNWPIDMGGCMGHKRRRFLERSPLLSVVTIHEPHLSSNPPRRHVQRHTHAHTLLRSVCMVCTHDAYTRDRTGSEQHRTRSRKTCPHLRLCHRNKIGTTPENKIGTARTTPPASRPTHCTHKTTRNYQFRHLGTELPEQTEQPDEVALRIIRNTPELPNSPIMDGTHRNT